MARTSQEQTVLPGGQQEGTETTVWVGAGRCSGEGRKRTTSCTNESEVQEGDSSAQGDCLGGGGDNEAFLNISLFSQQIKIPGDLGPASRNLSFHRAAELPWLTRLPL